MDPEFYGDDSHVELQRKLLGIEAILVRAPGFFNGGRGLGIEVDGDFRAGEIASLVRELGAVSLYFVRSTDLSTYDQLARNEGFTSTTWQLLESGRETASVSRAVVESRGLPPDYQEVAVGPDTEPAVVRAFQEVNAARGVTAMPGYMLRGLRYPTISRVFLDHERRVVATVYLSARHSSRGPHAGQFFLGMSSVRADQKGHGFGELIHARAIDRAYRELDVRAVYAAVQPDNAPAQRMCQRCGLSFQDRHLVAITDPTRFAKAFSR